MATKPKKTRERADVNTLAFSIVQQATAETAPASVDDQRVMALKKKGGRKGGRSRARKMTPEQRSAIARIAANARWKKEDA